ncbi:MAG: acetylornithine deacetylase [Planctomycetota bacterium]|nr:acetylornithine deacetylase [Planctomycetota bacterium]
MIQSTLDILRQLVSYDTTNPPREIATDGIFAYITRLLEPAGFELDLTDLGDGCITLFARRGAPTTLFNVHLDTVPADVNWETDPFSLQTSEHDAIGLGACDIKGAAACLLASAISTNGSICLLFTSDEEAGQSRCVKTFLEHVPVGLENVVVAEPTQCKAVSAHRGLLSVEGVFHGRAAHGSIETDESFNANHQAARWVHRALDYAASREIDSFEHLNGIRLNVGVIEGGIKANVIASKAKVVFGFRPLPMHEPNALLKDLCDFHPHASWTTRFEASPLRPHEKISHYIDQLGLEPGPIVDFWTEAALFSNARYPTIVFGPGDIAQAHTAGEWVALDQLESATRTYTRLFSNASS